MGQRNVKDLNRSKNLWLEMTGEVTRNTLPKERHKVLHRPQEKERLDLRSKVAGRSLEENRDPQTRSLTGRREGKAQT